MRSLAAAAALSIVVCASALGQDTQICDNPPIPPRYGVAPDRYPTIVRVSPDDIFSYCGDSSPWACASPEGNWIVILNHEALKAIGLTMADTMCLLMHELAHIGGWPADHPP